MSALAVYERVLELLDRLAAVLVMVAMAVMSAVLIMQVALRYGLNTSLDWGWEVPRLCFICGILLAIPLGIPRGVHVGIDVVVRRLPPSLRRAVLRGVLLLMGGLIATVSWHAVSLARQTWDQMMPTLDLPTGIFFVALAISGVHCLLHFARLFWRGEWSAAGLESEA
jgi:TRAP-type C4-dicarboxylate transport system permease small subunit